MKNTLLFIPIGLSTLAAVQLVANSSGAPAGRTGSEASSNLTCAAAGCHNGPAPGANHQMTILSNIPIDGYVPGFTYAIDIDLEDTQNAAPLCGFSASVEDGSGNHVGTLVLSDPGATSLNGQGRFVTHRTASNTLPNTGRRYSFQWTAPSSATAPSEIKIYAAGNFANGNDSTSGDVIRAISSTFILNPGIGLVEDQLNSSVFPNPSKGSFTAMDPRMQAGAVRVQLFDLSGKRVADRLQKVDSPLEGVRMDAYELPRGMYTLQVEQNGLTLIRERLALN
jgi:hypothetical protein